MTNEERRKALQEARTQALAYAREADDGYADHGMDGPETNLATMWASVAQALKDGDPLHDAPDGRPSMGFGLPDGVVVR